MTTLRAGGVQQLLAVAVTVLLLLVIMDNVRMRYRMGASSNVAERGAPLQAVNKVCPPVAPSGGQVQPAAAGGAGVSQDFVDALQDFSYYLKPRQMLCDDMGTYQNGDALQWPQLYLQHKEPHNKYYNATYKKTGLKVYDIGNVGHLHKQTLLFLNFINRTRFIHNVCEVGFNAGHSSLVWLTGNTNTRVHSFDAGYHPYSPEMARYINKTFPGRHSITWGDSKKTIPEFTRKYPNHKCDLIWIDGGHDYPEVIADIKNLRAHAKKDHHFILMDDLPITGALGTTPAWKEAVKKGIVQEYYKCNFKTQPYRGYTLARYLNV